MWYVIQVINGREDVMRERIERMVPAGAMQELFYPQYQTEIKVHGEWVSTTKPLFPGYLICDTSDPRTVQQYLVRMDDFARVLSQDGQFVPLSKEETQLIGSFTNRGDRVGPQARTGADHPARGRLLRSAHLPHARHGLQQRTTYLPPRDLVD